MPPPVPPPVGPPDAPPGGAAGLAAKGQVFLDRGLGQGFGEQRHALMDRTHGQEPLDSLPCHRLHGGRGNL